MFYNTKSFHRLFDVAVKKSRNLEYPTSCFLTKDKIEISIDVSPGKREKPLVSITVRKSDGNDVKVMERYDFFSDGGVDVFVSMPVRGIVGEFVVRRLTYDYEYNKRQVLAGILDDELDALADLLTDMETVRVNPYNINQILDDEDDEIARIPNADETKDIRLIEK